MFTLEPLNDDIDEDVDFRYGVYAATIKPYLDQFLDWDEAQHRDMVRTHLAGSGTPVAIVVNGTRVGAALIEETDGLIHLHQIAILPAYQGCGTGTAVIRMLLQRADASNRSVRLNVFVANEGGRRLYAKLGFQVVEVAERDIEMRYDP